MPVEPNWTAAIIAGLSSIIMTLFGVEYYALVWGLVGALLALTQIESMPIRQAVLHVTLSTLIGAALGSAGVEFFSATHRVFLIIGSLVGGAGAQILVGEIIKSLLARIKKLGGSDGPAQPSP
jgi:hypothetical protein